MKRATFILTSLGTGLLFFRLGIPSGSSSFAFAQQAPQGSQPDPIAAMPDAPGKTLTVQTCSKCHAITHLTTQHRDADGWAATISKMVGYGATGSDEELQQVLDYLTKYYGPTPPPTAAASTKVSVNKATVAQLVTDLGLTEDEAKAVVNYREKNGAFKSIEDLKKVPNVDGKKFDAHAGDLQF